MRDGMYAGRGMWIAGESVRFGGSYQNNTIVLSSVTTTSTSGGVGGANRMELEFMEPSYPNYGAKKLRLGVQGGGYVKMEFPGSGGLYAFSPYGNADRIHLGYGGVNIDMLYGGYTTNENMLIRCVNDIVFCSAGSGETARFDSNKRLGIGTTAPNSKLHIGSGTNTDVTVGSQATPAFQIGGTNNYRLGMYTDSETGYIENRNGDDGIAFRVKTAGEAMRIDGGTGNVGMQAHAYLTRYYP